MSRPAKPSILENLPLLAQLLTNGLGEICTLTSEGEAAGIYDLPYHCRPEDLKVKNKPNFRMESTSRITQRKITVWKLALPGAGTHFVKSKEVSAGIEYKEWVAYPTTVLRGQQLEVAPIIVAGPRHALFLAETPNGPRHVPNHKSKQIYLRGHMYLAKIDNIHYRLTFKQLDRVVDRSSTKRSPRPNPKVSWRVALDFKTPENVWQTVHLDVTLNPPSPHEAVARDGKVTVVRSFNRRTECNLM